MRNHSVVTTILVLVLLLVPAAWAQRAQLTPDDYARANAVRTKFQGLAVNLPEPARAIEKTSRFWYRKSVKGGNEFVVVDAETLVKRPAFDHEKLASSLAAATNEKIGPLTLPLQTFSFIDNERAISFVQGSSIWRCELSDYACKKTGQAPALGQFGRPPVDDPPEEFGNDVYDGMVDLLPQQGQQRRPQEGRAPEGDNTKASPDGKWEALIRNFNVFLRSKGKNDAQPLSMDGSEGNYYTFASINWSPDSKRLIAYRVRP